MCVCVMTAGQQQEFGVVCVKGGGGDDDDVCVCDDSWTATRVWWLCVLRGR